jgi:hypothetical protein
MRLTVRSPPRAKVPAAAAGAAAAEAVVDFGVMVLLQCSELKSPAAMLKGIGAGGALRESRARTDYTM